MSEASEPRIGRPPDDRGAVERALAVLGGAAADPHACWPWPGSVNQNDYPTVFAYSPRPDGSKGRVRKSYLVPRLLYAAARGLDPAGPWQTRRTCGSKLCCNPAHRRPHADPE